MSSMFSCELSGDWSKAISTLKNIQNNVYPMFSAQLYENGDLVLDKIQGHIDAQDLGWTNLSEHTVELKGGDATIYVETGELRDSFKVMKVKSSQNNATIVVGIEPNQTHGDSGVKMSDLMVWLEYGTDKMPPRPLIRPVFEEVQKLIQDNWKGLFEKVVKGG